MNPLALYLQRSEPRPSELFHRIFRCPIHLDAALDVVEYTRKDVEAPLPHANAELAKQSDAIVADYIARMDAAEPSPTASTPFWSSYCRTAPRRRRSHSVSA